MSGPARKGPAYPVFLVIPQVVSRMSELLGTLEAVSELASRSHLLGVDLYYRTSTGTAILGLSFDPRVVAGEALTNLATRAGRAGAAFIDGSRLPERARRRFHDEYLPQYDVRRDGLGSIEEAIGALAAEVSSPPTSAPDHIEVRYRRGDAWQLARVRSMTREGVSIATGTPPRRGAVVELELGAAGVVLTLRATVVGVALGDAATALGASGFGARFLLSSEEQRARLEEILRVIGTEKLRSLDPPPRRRAARYPVNWPVSVRSPGSRVTTSALDVSRFGMFVGGSEEMEAVEGPVHVTLPIDDGGTPVLATARVARQIPWEVARSRGVPAGIGIELVSLSQKDEQRFAAFVERVGRRAEREIIVCASPDRLPGLTDALSAAGYCTTGVTDPTGLVDRTTAGVRTPDLVVLDASALRDSPRALQNARRALAVRLIRLLTVDGEAPATLRESVDGALL